MSYDLPEYRTFSFGVIDFGNGNSATSFKGPAGKKGKITEIHVSASETFSNTTTEAFVRIGTTADADAYAEMALGTLANTDSATSSQDDTDAIISDALPADTQIEVAFVAPTGGTPAGQGYVQIFTEWY